MFCCKPESKTSVPLSSRVFFACTIYCLFFFIKSLTLNINQLFIHLHHWSDQINWLWFIWGKKELLMSHVTLMKHCCNSVDSLLEKLRENYAALEENGEIKIFLFPLILGKQFVTNLWAYSFAYGSWLEEGRSQTGLTRVINAPHVGL